MENLIAKLVDLGLSHLEATAYINLLKNKSLTATEVSRLTGINRTQTYDILPKLIQRGICTEIRGNIKRYSAVEPEKVLASLERELDKKKAVIRDLNGSLAEIYNTNSETNPLDFLQVLSSRNSIISKIEVLETAAEKSVLAFNKPPYAMNIGKSNVSEVSAEIRKPEQFSIKRGVKFRSLYEIESTDWDAFINKVKHFEKMGEEVRISKHLPFKMFVFDEQTVMLALQNKADISLSFTTMTFEHSDFAEAMAGIFEIYWNKAKTIGELLKNKK
jgi:HTH-type transcriptional regulator, sugar sensing transcriptional regulator